MEETGLKDCSSTDSSVETFYKDSVVLITGGTGFIGKVLIEKLLRCFEVKRIYLLLREKKNVKSEERLKELLQEPIFHVMKNNNPTPPSVFAKVIAIDTNFQQDRIISDGDRKLLLSEVTVVFNVMASVKFNEHIESALDTNVNCSRKLFDMVSQMQRIRSIVHVSTFYSNCDRSHIEERVFDDVPFGGHDNILRIFEHLSAPEKDKLIPAILGPMPNSYTFSKKCAEIMIKQSYAHLPIAIFRPPIVMSAYMEPIPGWVDNFNGIAGMCIPMTQGKIYCARGKPDMPSHSVPVDYCVAALLAVGAEIRRNPTPHQGSESPMVYNFATDHNNIRWGDYGWWAAHGCETRLGKIFGNLRLVKRVLALEDAACFFAMHRWTVQNDNMRRVLGGLSEQERNLLQFDIDKLDWKDYFKNFLPGIKAALSRCSQRRRKECG
ncbi:fatty acyl-CoA reductase wat-like isoform X2 [Malaya genurostris]|uniref:fatty acyl-CoA reductase wat-like isoform X2 n=1 Tax=Malaya genurostris TaxID=325434 RepID=UPI0026F3BAE2|nr:fatty acyl-CoA reductase wat-like isoform X2 [Malaya genurostris]